MASAASLRRLEAEPRWVDARCVQMIAAVSRVRFAAHVRTPCVADPVYTRRGVALRAIDLSRALVAPLDAPRRLWREGERSPWMLAAEYIIAYRDAAAAVAAGAGRTPLANVLFAGERGDPELARRDRGSLGRDSAVIGVSCAGVFLLINGLEPAAPPWSFGKLAVNLHRWPRETIAAWLHQ